MLRWNFDVERVDVILGHNVEYTGSTSRLPILVLECSKGSHLEGGGGHAMSKCHPIALFLLLRGMWKPLNLDTGVLSACTWRQRFWGVNPSGRGGPGGPHCPMKISTDIINFKFQSCLACPPPSRWPPFEHSSTKMGSLDVEPVYSTHCVPVSHLHVPHQNSTSTCFSTV